MFIEVVRVEWSPSMDLFAILMLNNTIEVILFVLLNWENKIYRVSFKVQKV